MQELLAPALAGALALVTLGLVVVLWRGRSRLRAELEQTRAEASGLRHQVEEIERRLESPPPAATAPAVPTAPVADYVITRMGEERAEGAAPVTVDRALFADLVLRESVVKAAGLAHGLRRALAPESRNRIRFEVRREVKRSRKQRRADLREARRDWAARQRADDEDAA